MTSKQPKRKVVIVDDHTLFRNGLRILLNTLEDYQVVAEAANGKQFLDLLEKEVPDLVLLVAQKLHPDLKIITLSMYGEEDYYYKMVNAGVKGFVLKNSDIKEVKTALDVVYDGGSFFSSELLQNLVNSLKSSSKSKEFHAELSEREMEILILICQGLSNQEIGDKLFISKRTVDKHRANILEKSESKNTAQLVVYAIKNKLVEL